MKHDGMVVAIVVLLCAGCGGGRTSVETPDPEPAPTAETVPETTAPVSTLSPDDTSETTPSESTAPSPATETEMGGTTAEAASPAPPPASESTVEVKEASRARITDKHIVISGKVLFETGKAKLKKVSFPVLDEVVYAMEKHPEIIKIQVIGHTDSDGDAKANKRLSKRRATAVMKYMIRKGIEKDRLSAVGEGEDQPIADNSTEAGKDKNRRVEFSIVERANVVATTHTTSTVAPGSVDNRKATDDETEELIKKEGLDKKF